MGVKRLDLFHTRRVEKSYWDASAMKQDVIRRHLMLGLEQARDTVVPQVHLHRRFRPFVEEVLMPRLDVRRGLIAHPGSGQPCPRAIGDPATVVIGPEGGFVAFEVERLLDSGLLPVDLGPRILRVETAVVALLARLG